MFPHTIGVWWWIFGSRSAFKVHTYTYTYIACRTICFIVLNQTNFAKCFALKVFFSLIHIRIYSVLSLDGVLVCGLNMILVMTSN